MKIIATILASSAITKILGHLDLSARASFAQIAKETRISIFFAADLTQILLIPDKVAASPSAPRSEASFNLFLAPFLIITSIEKLNCPSYRHSNRIF